MPDPINRNTPSPPTHYERDVNEETSSQRTSSVSEPAAGLADGDAMCQAEGEFSRGAERLLSSNVRPSLASFVESQQQLDAASTSSEPSTDAGTASDNSNAERTAALDTVQLGYADAGQTRDGGSVYAGVALIKGSEGGMQAEIASVSLQHGEQSELQAGVARVALGSDSEHAAVRAFEAEVHCGTHNPDGSTGINLGASANAIAAEAHYERAGNGVTAGLSAGVGMSASVGVRDADADGETEYCASFAAGPITVGLCLEAATISNALRSLVGDEVGGSP